MLVRSTRERIILGACSGLGENEIERPPVLLGGSALAGPVWRVVELVGHVRRPETTQVTVEQVSLYRLAQTRGPTLTIRFPAGEEDERAPKREVRPIFFMWRLGGFQAHDVEVGGARLRGFRSEERTCELQSRR